MSAPTYRSESPGASERHVVQKGMTGMMVALGLLIVLVVLALIGLIAVIAILGFVLNMLVEYPRYRRIRSM